jgi:hypothetical protein
MMGKTGRDQMEERIQFIDYKGKKILLEDFTNIKDEEEFIRLIKAAGEIVQQQPPKSTLVIVDLTNSRFTDRVSRISKETASKNTPHIKASVLVGVRGLMEIMIKAVSAFTHRDLISMRTREEAMEWLIKQ